MLHLLDDRSDPVFDETLFLWFFLSPFYMEEGKMGEEMGKNILLDNCQGKFFIVKHYFNTLKISSGLVTATSSMSTPP